MKGSAPITCRGPPVGLFSASGVLNVRPPSVERTKSRSSLADDLPEEAVSHATYTLSWNGLLGLVSTAIMGLSLNFPLPLLKLKYVTWGQLFPPSKDLATAISVP